MIERAWQTLIADRGLKMALVAVGCVLCLFSTEEKHWKRVVGWLLTVAAHFCPCIVVFCLACPPAIAGDRPPIELPAWYGNYWHQGHGSCAYAAAADLLALHGYDAVAGVVRRNYGGGAMPGPARGCASLVDLAQALGTPYDYTESADMAWLRAAGKKGLGAVVHWYGIDRRGRLYGAHAVAFLGFDADDEAWYADSNQVGQYLHMPAAQFAEAWRRSGGDAFTFVFPTQE
jgi:hypothetical protein